MWELVRWLHLLAMAFFVGGQIVLAGGGGAPGRRARGGGRAPPPAGRARAPLRAIARRFGQGTLVAIAVLVATGSAMAGHYGDWSSSTLQVKLGLVVLVAVLVGAHLRRPTNHALDGLIFVGSLAIV